MEQDPSSASPQTEFASLEVRVSGRVQGVGFRYFTHEAARRLRLTGYVRNLRDGGLRAYVEGPKGSLKEFLRLMHEGPQGGRVHDLRATWGSATGQYSTFSIERTL
jgi:acylphosphatase